MLRAKKEAEEEAKRKKYEKARLKKIRRRRKVVAAADGFAVADAADAGRSGEEAHFDGGGGGGVGGACGGGDEDDGDHKGVSDVNIYVHGEGGHKTERSIISTADTQARGGNSSVGPGEKCGDDAGDIVSGWDGGDDGAVGVRDHGDDANRADAASAAAVAAAAAAALICSRDSQTAAVGVTSDGCDSGVESGDGGGEGGLAADTVSTPHPNSGPPSTSASTLIEEDYVSVSHNVPAVTTSTVTAVTLGRVDGHCLCGDGEEDVPDEYRCPHRLVHHARPCGGDGRPHIRAYGDREVDQ